MSLNNIQPIILCGGTGSRLWPASRNDHPKQFIKKIFGKYSLYQSTLLRLKDAGITQEPIVISNVDQRFFVSDQADEVNIKIKSNIVEPLSKNTAPAITMGVLESLFLRNNKNHTLLILSSDHIIKNINKFRQSCNAAQIRSKEKKIIVFGVSPTHPNTGYGYIKIGNKTSRNSFEVVNFEEKPNKVKANKFTKNKDYFWNSGIFMFDSSLFIEEINIHEPKLFQLCIRAFNNKKIDLNFTKIEKAFYEKCKAISFDYAILEKTNKIEMVCLNTYWSDLGSWDAYFDYSKKDKNSNVVIGDVIDLSCSNNLFLANNRLVVALGLKNLIIVDTKDALFVSSKDHLYNLKNLVLKMTKKNRSEFFNSKEVHRPWGSYTSISDSNKYQIKKILVKPKGKLSLQKHEYRAEHWVVIDGKAKVTIDNEVFFVTKNQSVYIPCKKKHRLENTSRKDLILIEIQTGSYFGEDDIVRFDDVYGRIQDEKN